MADIHDHVQVVQALQQLGLVPDGGDVPPIIIGEANDGINVGDGLGLIYGGKVGVSLKFRTLKAGAGIVIATDEENEVVSIAATGTGSGDVEGTPPSRTNDFELYIEGEDPNSPSTWYRLIGLEYTEPNGVPSGTKLIVGSTDRNTILKGAANQLFVNTSPSQKVISEAINSVWSIPQRGTIIHADGDTQPALVLKNTGTQSGESKFFIGNRDPEGNITAVQSSIYLRKDGDVNSTLYFKKTGTGNTGWVNTVGSFVSGPASSVDDEIPRYNGTTGKIIKNSLFKLVQVSNINRFQIDDPNSPGTFLDAVRADYAAPNGTPSGTRMVLGSTSKRTVIESLGEIYSAITGNKKVITESILSDWAIPKPGSVTQSTDDTTRILELINSGTNPGNSKIYAGNRTPEANVTADQGSLYIRDDGANSAAYVKESGTGNTGWSNLVNPNVGFYAYRTAGTQTIPASTETKVEFPNKQDDPGGDFNTTTYVFTAPTKGTYSFSASAKLNMDKDTEYYLRLYHNSTLVSESSTFSGFVFDMTVHVSIARRQMNASDTMEVRAFQNDALGRTLQNTALHFAGVQLRKDL
jgi:hypothetical protein